MVSGGIGIVQFLAVFPAIIYIDSWGESTFDFDFLCCADEFGCRPKIITTG